MLTRRDLIKCFLLACIMTVINCWAITNLDRLLATYIESYQVRSSYVGPVSAHFIIAVFLIPYGLKYGRLRMLPFVYVAFSVCIPLIFLNSSFEVHFLMESSLKSYYQDNFCQSDISQPLCGKALAHMVFLRIIGALPLLFLMPLLIYLVIKMGYFGSKFDAKSR